MREQPRPGGEPVDTATHVAAHELDHDAQAALEIADQLATARQHGDDARAGELLDRLRRALERLRRDIASLLTDCGGDLDSVQRQPVNVGEYERALELAGELSAAPGAGGKPIHEWLEVRPFYGEASTITE